MAPESAPWSIDDARALYNIEEWGLGYFDVNERGNLAVHPTRERGRGLDLFEIATDLSAQGVGLPLLLRFPDIIRTRIEALVERFAIAREEHEYTGGYTPVYPIKVNQQRRVVEGLVAAGAAHGVGLEVGSKPELQAVLALTDRADHLIICNGYKDEEYVRLALMGQRLGHEVIVVIEKISELELLLQLSTELSVKPSAGVRIRLSSAGAGRWSGSAGEASKFGLSAFDLMKMIERLGTVEATDVLRMIHFHLGSQISDILSVKQAMTEVSRYYVELHAAGLSIEYVDVGGGLGVDYEGSRSSRFSSVNYSIQEYANDIVYALAEACRESNAPMPHIISESGRALTAHHALLLVDVIGVESMRVEAPCEVPPGAHAVVHDLLELWRGMEGRPLREVYHDASYGKERMRSLFNSGVVSLPARAAAERLFLSILARGVELARKAPEEHEDILQEMERLLVDRYFCNFSVFQSLPDAWAVDQLFPVVPIHRLDERPDRRGALHDITCDSDGRIDQFVGDFDPGSGLPLHVPASGEPYVLGIFLAGAYQEILGDLHNLFGDTNTVHLCLGPDGDGSYEVADLAHGNTVAEVLGHVQFDSETLVANFRRKVGRAEGLSRGQANNFIADYVSGLAGYTYLEGAGS